MLLTISTTHRPADDLGYLLHKHPQRVHEFALPYGTAHVFYPEATEDRCTAALLLEIDPLHIARRGFGVADAAPLGAYVNDRPYVASSYLSVALAKVVGSAMGGRSKERPELAGTPIPLIATLEVVPSRDAGVPRRLFEPLGYRVETSRLANDLLDSPGAAEPALSPYVTLRLEGTVTVAELLTHLYVLMPVLDDAKHYFIGDDEVEKLLSRAGTWLSSHPEREFIATRYLKHQRWFADAALARLSEGAPPLEEEVDAPDVEPAVPATPLNQQRIDAIVAALHGVGAHTVIDLGCGEGRLLGALYEDRDFTRIVGMDVSPWSLRAAGRRLHLDNLPERQRDRLQVMQGSLLYRDARLSGFDAGVLSEVIEHIEPDQLPRLERVVFGEAHPNAVIVTTPNRDFNARIPALAADERRHRDHRFEWSRAEFGDWATSVAERFGYSAEVGGIGEADPALGSPTQVAVFRA
ncbi:MAG: 3' terminal RNA ribose 2'-O-methyltransferase Hen1 [Chloroflexi bacterium]|nr:3' terminal RNA ribose 2'-O-methyltransferase Hen1 [Chloroflexota bacterium]MDA1145380.1 3' terminal RNA ribose 2'-O-methyltransferase Hen1 [Chloroflexota bacterium]